MRTKCLRCGDPLTDKNAQDVGICLTCFAIENSDFSDEDDDSNLGPDYWECLSCGHSSVERPAFGGQCPKCTAQMEEGYY